MTTDLMNSNGERPAVAIGGPLSGLRVIEMAGIGPAPYAAMLLADMGADVIRVERPGGEGSSVPAEQDVLRRNRRAVVLDVRKPGGLAAARRLIVNADVIIEGFRPGVMERLGLGPDDCLAINPKLIYGRMTGWGQHGPLAGTAGHDIDYIAITGALHAIGRADSGPVVPLNLLGDFGAGSTFLVMGVLAACWESARSGRGQVVDAAIVDGASSLTALQRGMMAVGLWTDERETNMLDGGVPWYDTYETSDGKWMAVGALEPKFFAEFVRVLGVEADESDRENEGRWPQLRRLIDAAFRSRTRDEWAEAFEGTDACVAPVFSLTEAPTHPHLAERQAFITAFDIVQPAPAPRFSRTISGPPTAPPSIGQHTAAVLIEAGVSDVDTLFETGAAVQA